MKAGVLFVVVSLLTDLNAGRLEGRIRVLLGAEQKNMSKPLQPLKMSQFVKGSILETRIVFHRELFQAEAILHFI